MVPRPREASARIDELEAGKANAAALKATIRRLEKELRSTWNAGDPSDVDELEQQLVKSREMAMEWENGYDKPVDACVGCCVRGFDTIRFR
jgi:DNA-binding IclR family transcriptional regulator